ncbi:SoxS protein [Paracoccus sp. MBLB3053]|uniref:SoxS protein n=1 Tax=Paracoccus aurantius TaxID=3073814 RepID=A0ABU2HQ29_9RHOB|nr:SoxS protein [Paracoccus sp. MBLB3053]MDS9467152.1 SoxS protein [Paracoccus sp. MBLB3053]
MKNSASLVTRRLLLAMGLSASIHRAQAGPAPQLRLLMVRRKGCTYCAQWDREIAPIYADHPEGRLAPLIMVDVDGPYPDGLALARMPWLTPGFILLRDGQEIGRYEGYPGADRFFPMLRGLINEADRWG